MIKLAYYARPLNIYDTPQEDRDKKLMSKAGFSIVDVNTQSMQDAYDLQGMVVFENVVRAVDVLFFRGFIDGSIPAGVMKEIHWAQDAGVPVFELPSQIERRVLSVDDTRALLEELGQR